jgi:hypothetical protein
MCANVNLPTYEPILVILPHSTNRCQLTEIDRRYSLLAKGSEAPLASSMSEAHMASGVLMCRAVSTMRRSRPFAR